MCNGPKEKEKSAENSTDFVCFKLTGDFGLRDAVQGEGLPAVKLTYIRTTPGFACPFVPEGCGRQGAQRQSRYDEGEHPAWMSTSSQVQIRADGRSDERAERSGGVSEERCCA